MASTTPPAAPDHVTASPRAATSLGYLPALDGLRGLAAIGIVAFHAQLTWARGGFLAVTTFFALSGFLLTSLLVAEHQRSGRVDVLAFWGRRFRRLLPAALVTLGLVSALAPWLATPEQLASLRGDVVAALAYVLNWRFIIEGRAYADLFSAPSPVQHFWTLSVEEQFFVVLPGVVLIVAALAARRARGADDPHAFRRLLLVTLGVATVGSIAWLWTSYDPATDSAAGYYGTGTRASEFLLGALLAVALGRPELPASTSLRRSLRLAGPIALVALLALWSIATDTSQWLYHGGFTLVAALSVVVLASSLQPGWLTSGLAAAPLREVGRRSYGIYLVHWPVFVWLTADRVGLDGYALLAFQLAVIAILTVVSFQYLEQPIRTRRVLRGATVPALAVGGVVVVAMLAVVATIDPPEPELVFDRVVDPTTAAGPVDVGAPTVLVVGDSLASNVAAGLSRLDPSPLVLWDRSTPGCGLAESERRVEVGDWKVPDPGCQPSWRQRWAAEIEAIAPDVVVVQVGTQELWDRRVDGRVVEFDTPEGDALAASELDEAFATLSSGGAPVLALTMPVTDWTTWGLQLADEDRSVNNPAWVAHWNDLVRQAAARNPAVTVADVGDLLTPGGEFRADIDGVAVRAGDRLHLTEAGQDLVAEWLVPQLADAGTSSG